MPRNPQPEPQTRSLVFERAALDTDSRTVPLSVSSDTADVVRYVPGYGLGVEVLSHEPGAVDLRRFKGPNGGPLLYNHDKDKLLGRFIPSGLEDGKLRGVARFAKNPDGERAWQDVQDGNLTEVSIWYRYDEKDVEVAKKATRNELPVYLVKRWELLESSMVTVPADPEVGIGRDINVTVNVSATEVETDADEASEAGEDSRSAVPPVTPTPPASAAGTPEVRMDTPTTPAASPAAPPNVDELRTRDVQAALQIRALAAKFGLERDAEELLVTRTIEEARTELMFRLTDKQPHVSSPLVDLTEKEAKSWSLVRAINALVDQAEGRKASGFEVEISDELAKKNPSSYSARGGIFVPMQLRAGLDSISAGKGNELKFMEYGGELIELLRNVLVLQQMGVRTLSGLTSPLAFPAQTGADSAYWVSENPAADVTASTLTLGSKTLIPKTLQASTSFSRQLLQQAVYGVEQLVREDFVAVHARAYDLAGIHGTGADGGPMGIYQTPNVSTVAFGGAATWANILSMVAKVLNANALTGSLGFATNPTMAGVLMAKPKVSSYPEFIWSGKMNDGSVAGYRALASAQISGTMSTLAQTGGSEQGLIFGNWADAILGFFGAAEIIIDPYSLKKRGMIELTSFQMVDFLVRHPGSFCVSTGLTTA